jgi:hypothetical protein
MEYQQNIKNAIIFHKFKKYLERFFEKKIVEGQACMTSSLMKGD